MEFVLVFPKDLLDFGSDAIKKKGIIYLGCYSSKGYASVIFSDSEIFLFGEWEDAAFRPFIYSILSIYCIT